jgi:hypothetical protein
VTSTFSAFSLAALSHHLLWPETVEIAVEANRAERERLAREQAKTRAQSDRELSETKKRIVHISPLSKLAPILARFLSVYEN